MKVYSLYDRATGIFAGRTFGTDIADPVEHVRAVRLNTPDGHGAMPGVHDHLSTRVDVEAIRAEDDAAATAWAAVKDRNRLRRAAGATDIEDPPEPAPVEAAARHVVDYQPPQPSADHEWNGDTKRWQLTADAAERAESARRARAEIARLNSTEHPSLVRAAILDEPGAREKLAALHTQIAQLEGIANA